MQDVERGQGKYNNFAFPQFTPCVFSPFMSPLRQAQNALAFALILLMVAACSQKKPGGINRFYHNTTSEYNWLFNDNELFKAAQAQVMAEKKDDYLHLMPVFVAPTESQQKNLYPQMDAIIEKCTTLIDRHGMLIKKKEHNRWIDDS